MTLSDERIMELEKRVAHLERVIEELKADSRRTEVLQAETVKQARNEGEDRVPLEPIQSRREEGRPSVSRQAPAEKSGRKDNEALIGKYIIGVLAAVLIFVAAVSFVGLIWNRITPEIKLLLLSSAGVILSALGFWKIRTKKNPITSLILGTGAGLLFIDILSANLVFHKIGNNMSIVLAGAWALVFVLSSRYTNLFFTTIIAYIGSYITLILGLLLMESTAQLCMLFLFVSAISGAMIYSALKKRKAELLTVILLVFLSYSTILFQCWIVGLFGGGQLPGSYLVLVAVILILYLLMNVFYKIMKDMTIIPVYLLVGIVSSLLTMMFFSYISHTYPGWKTITSYLLFFAVNLIQLLLNYVFYEKIEPWLTRYYGVVLVLTSFFINIEWHRRPVGIVLAGVILIICEKIVKRERHSLLIGGIVLLDSLFLLFDNSHYFVFSVYGIVQLGLMGYVLWKCGDLKKSSLTGTLKTIGIIVVIANSFGIPSNVIRYMNGWNLSSYAAGAAGYFIAVAALLVLSRAGYFKNWEEESFQFFGKNDSLKEDGGMRGLLYVISTGLYFYGLQRMAYADSIFLQMVVTLAAIAVTLMQSRLLLSGRGRDKTLTGIWIVLKYLILIWTILLAFSDLRIISVVYSIAGLLVAIGSITMGFKLENKGIRLYGLILTIIMAAKFILVDLSQENSITRVLALIAGGGLCFFISFIYNKLNENYGE